MMFRDHSSAPTPTTTLSAAASADKTFLDVPFAEKDEAKRLGARWDSARRQWYAPRGEPALVERWGTAARQLTSLAGEDRTFGADELRMEFFPKSCWCKKVRYAIDRDEVPRVEDLVFGRVNRTCETCGLQDLDKPFHLHGRWDYDEPTHTQKLVRLMALCDDCFNVTHFGATSYAGRRDYATAHWMKVTGRTFSECTGVVDAAYDRMRELNEHEWHLDLSLLADNGVTCAKPKSGGMFGSGRSGSRSGSGSRSRTRPSVAHRDTHHESASASRTTFQTASKPSGSGLGGFAFRTD